MAGMCSNYRPVSREDRLLNFFGALRADPKGPPEVFPLGLAPFVRLAEDGSGNRICDDGHFGLLPHFAAELAYGRHTYNARSETVASKASFRASWKAGRRCIVPAEVVFEPCWETGQAVRWAIQRPGQVPMGIAGIYSAWRAPDGRQAFSFAMLTVNADGHPIFQRMHRPGDEKRMVVILDEADYGRWLSCPVEEAPSFFRQHHGPLETFPEPLKRTPRASSVRSTRPPPPGDDDDQANLL